VELVGFDGSAHVGDAGDRLLVSQRLQQLLLRELTPVAESEVGSGEGALAAETEAVRQIPAGIQARRDVVCDICQSSA